MPSARESEEAGRSPAEVLQALGHRAPRAPVEDSPRWHLTAAEEAMDDGHWDVARAAIHRARESIVDGSADADEASFAALRLAVSTVDVHLAAAEISALAARMDASDPVWNRRVRRLVGSAPPAFPGSMCARLLELVPALLEDRAGGSVSTPGLYVESFPVPAGGLPLLPDEDPSDGLASVAGEASTHVASPGPLAPIPTESPFAAAARARRASPPEAAEDDVVVFDEDALPASAPPHGFTGRVFIAADESDLQDADALRDRLVEEMLASITEEEGQVLFATASTFLNNGQYETAEIVFSAAMQLPDLRLAACEGLMQALVAAGRHTEAVATGARAERIFAREGDALLGIVYWHGVAAQALGATDAATGCFQRVLAHPQHVHFPELAARMAALR
jgi:hypothetical protein